MHGNLCDMTKSSITMLNDKNETHMVLLNNPTLQIKNVTVNEAIEKYTTSKKVEFIYKKKSTKIGIIMGYSVIAGNKYISKDDK